MCRPKNSNICAMAGDLSANSIIKQRGNGRNGVRRERFMRCRRICGISSCKLNLLSLNVLSIASLVSLVIDRFSLAFAGRSIAVLLSSGANTPLHNSCHKRFILQAIEAGSSIRHQCSVW